MYILIISLLEQYVTHDRYYNIHKIRNEVICRVLLNFIGIREVN